MEACPSAPPNNQLEQAKGPWNLLWICNVRRRVPLQLSWKALDPALSRSPRLASALPVPVPVSPSGPLSLAFQPNRSGERLASNVHLSAVARCKRASGAGTGTGTGTGRKERTGEICAKQGFRAIFDDLERAGR